jgi:hypothetical protein
MTKKIIIVTIPGIGTKEEGYSKDFENDILKFSKGSALHDNFEIEETLPFKLTQVDKNQRALFDRLIEKNKLGGVFSLRKFALEAFGDAVTFERNPNSPDSSYRKIHEYLKNEFEKAYIKLAKNKKSKLVIVAASMGAQILSTYIWDADHNLGIFEKKPAIKENILKNLDYLVTVGCNIPLFVSGTPRSKIKAFAKRNKDFKWDNYYDQDDILGWPLEELSSSYERLVNDYEINTGQYIGSHTRYWKDNDFTKPFTDKLKLL